MTRNELYSVIDRCIEEFTGSDGDIHINIATVERLEHGHTAVDNIVDAILPLKDLKEKTKWNPPL